MGFCFIGVANIHSSMPPVSEYLISQAVFQMHKEGSGNAEERCMLFGPVFSK